MNVESEGRADAVGAEDHQVWLHLSQHPPQVAAVVAEMSAKDLGLLTSRLRARGHEIGLTELDDMYVTVELAPDLLGKLHPEQLNGRAYPGEPARLGTLTQPE